MKHLRVHEFHAEKVVSALLEALNDNEAGVRTAVAKSLGNLRYVDEKVISALLEALNDSGRFVRMSVAESLGKLGYADERVISALLQALNDKDDSIREIALESLIKLGHSDRKVTSALLNHKDDHVRKERFEKSGKMHWWEISREDGTDPTDYLTLVVNKDDYTVQGWYALDDSAGSEKTFQAVVDAVRLALNNDRLLNDLGYIVEPVTASPITEEMKASVLCHTAKLNVKILTTSDLS